MTSYKVLIVEDDQTLQGVLSYNLSKEGYEVLTASDGMEALEAARSLNPDLVVLDIMLPKLDGLEVCRILRQEMNVPILMLTARTEEIDKVVGLELGADDYVTKPFNMRELLARVKAVLRRAGTVQEAKPTIPKAITPTITAGDLQVDHDHHQVRLGTTVLELSPKEFDLLAFLVANKGRVFSRDLLLEKIWGYDYVGGTRTVDVHIRWLRRKIESDPANPKHLMTVRSVGYKFEE